MGRTTAWLGLVVLAAARLATAQPANDDCANATVIGALPFTDTVDTTAATTEAGDPTFQCDDGNFEGQAARSVWYRYTSASGGSLEVDTFGSDYDTHVLAWRGTCGSFTLVDCNNDDLDNNYFDEQSRVIVTLSPGETIYLEATSDVPAGGNLVLNVKATPIFQVTDDAEDDIHVPDVTAAPDGTFLVVWQQGGYPNQDIVGRRYCDTGVPIGDVFKISSDPTYGRFSRVGRAGSEGFVVVWEDHDPDGIRGRRVTASGVPLGAEFEVSTTSPAYFGYSAVGVAADAAGNFVVTWGEYGGDGDGLGVAARRFDDSGVPLGPAFQVNTYTTAYQFHSSVTSDAAGNFVVVWQSYEQDGSNYGVFGRRFDAAGAPLGGEFQVNTTTLYQQFYPAVAGDPSGNFVVVWHDLENQCGTDYCVTARRYDAAGVAQGGEFAASNAGSGPFGDVAFPDVVANASGDFVVAWVRSYDYPLARAFAADGTPQGPAFQLSHLNDDYQYFTKAAVADDGDFVVVWDWTQWGSHYVVMGRAESQSPSCPTSTTGCPATPRTGCKQPTLLFKGKLTLRDTSESKSDALTWKWIKGEATTVPEIGDPLATDSYTVCLYDGDDTLLLEGTVPPGGTCGTKPCWKDLDGLGFRYVDRAAAQAGISKVVLKSADAGRAKVIVKGKGTGLTMPTLPPTLPVRAQLSSTTGTCWEAEFQAAGVVQSSSTVWSGKPQASSPSGAFLDRP